MEEALKSDGSVFMPGASIWSAENVEDLYDRSVENPDESLDNFDDKLRRQLEGSPRRADASDGGGVGKVEEAGVRAQYELERAEAVLQD